MLLAGDEIGRSQNGNNNPYCQDNEMSWIDWSRKDDVFYRFVQTLLALRRDNAVFRQSHYDGAAWYRNDGQRMTANDWHTPWARAFAMFIDASSAEGPQEGFYIAFNAHFEGVTFTIPPQLGGLWTVVVDTSDLIRLVAGSSGITALVTAHALVVLRRLPHP